MRYNKFVVDGVTYRRIRPKTYEFIKNKFIVHKVPVYVSSGPLKLKNQLHYDILDKLVEYNVTLPKNCTLYFYRNKKDDVWSLGENFKTFANKLTGSLLTLYKKQEFSENIFDGSCFLIFKEQSEFLKFKLKNG